MNQTKILDFLSKYNQTDLLNTLKRLAEQDKLQLLNEVGKYLKIYQGDVIKEPFSQVIPLENCVKVESGGYKSIGLKSLKKQEVACLIFAAGDGSRFKFNKPKGLFCIERETSLFANLCKWVLAYEIQFKIKIPLLFLVSSKNKLAIQDHFERNQFFKLDPNKIRFLEQENYPFLNESGQWILNADNTIASGPNGNGDFFAALQRDNAIEFLKKQNIAYLQSFFIDNPLIDPLDPNLLGYLIEENLDASIHVFKRDNPSEKVGIICESKDSHFVVDYMQIDGSIFTKVKNGKLLFNYANSGHFCVKVEALADLASKKIKLPYHSVLKKINEKTFAWKTEKFAFDIFPYLKCRALCYDKKTTFAPLKSLLDVKDVRRLLKLKNKFIYKKIHQKSPPLNFQLMAADIANYLKG